MASLCTSSCVTTCVVHHRLARQEENLVDGGHISQRNDISVFYTARPTQLQFSKFETDSVLVYCAARNYHFHRVHHCVFVCVTALTGAFVN